jgi:hypothetical protein
MNSLPPALRDQVVGLGSVKEREFLVDGEETDGEASSDHIHHSSAIHNNY